MDVLEYQRRAMAKEADQEELIWWVKSQGVKAIRLSNAVRGLADDCGELNGAIKKWLEYQQPLDEVNVLEEVGDCLWRLAQICQGCGFTLAEAMEANLRKLEKVRYKGGRCNAHDAAEVNRDRVAERLAIAADDGVQYDDSPLMHQKDSAVVMRVEDANIEKVVPLGPGDGLVRVEGQTDFTNPKCGFCLQPLSDEVPKRLLRGVHGRCPNCTGDLTNMTHIVY